MHEIFFLSVLIMHTIGNFLGYPPFIIPVHKKNVTTLFMCGKVFKTTQTSNIHISPVAEMIRFAVIFVLNHMVSLH